MSAAPWPAKLAQAAERVVGLARRINAREVDRTEVIELHARLSARVVAMKSGLDLKLRSAGEALGAGGVLGPIPDELLAAELALRAVIEAVSTTERTRERIDAEMADLEGQLLDARHAFRQCQAAVAANALRDVIRNHIELFARASVARRAAFEWSRRVDEYAVTIPPEAIDEARVTLAAEMPAQEWMPQVA